MDLSSVFTSFIPTWTSDSNRGGADEPITVHYRIRVAIMMIGVLLPFSYMMLHTKRIPSSSSSYSKQTQIYGYRMSLWAEHLGFLESSFEQPESLECIRRVTSVAEMNWKQFAADEVTEMRGHLLKYPVQVDRTGKVTPLPGNETFPDLGGNITRTYIPIQENLTI